MASKTLQEAIEENNQWQAQRQKINAQFAEACRTGISHASASAPKARDTQQLIFQFVTTFDTSMKAYVKYMKGLGFDQSKRAIEVERSLEKLEKAARAPGIVPAYASDSVRELQEIIGGAVTPGSPHEYRAERDSMVQAAKALKEIGDRLASKSIDVGMAR